jgi:hypothetical protein
MVKALGEMVGDSAIWQDRVMLLEGWLARLARPRSADWRCGLG